MRTIRPASRYKKDYKREMRGPFHVSIDQALDEVILLLANDITLPVHLRDHPLTGKFRGCRDCHVKPDLVLIYCKPDAESLELLRLGTHSELDF